MDKRSEELICRQFKNAGKRLLLLDYDGTLVDYSIDPGDRFLPDSSIRLLKQLVAFESTDLYIITGRKKEQIDMFLEHVPVRVIAEHGAVIKNGQEWSTFVSGNILWKESITSVLKRFTDNCEGASFEVKTFSLTWHYRKCDPVSGYACSRRLIEELIDNRSAASYRILDGNMIVEVIANETGKGKAVQKLLELYNYDFILAAGDDTTDEEMFESLSTVNGSFTIHVGHNDTCARYKMNSVAEVTNLLNRLIL